MRCEYHPKRRDVFGPACDPGVGGDSDGNDAACEEAGKRGTRIRDKEQLE